MPGRMKGRARNTVPQQYDRQPRKAQPKPKNDNAVDFAKLLEHAQHVCQIEPGDENSLPLPVELWLRVAHFGHASALCRSEIVNRAGRQVLLQDDNKHAMWERLCELEFTSMWRSFAPSEPSSRSGTPLLAPQISPLLSSSCTEPATGLDALGATDTGENVDSVLPCPALPQDYTSSLHMVNWKQLYARRFLKQCMWDAARARTRTSSSLGDGQDAASNAGGGRLCAACGERFQPGAASRTECISHPGEFLPRRCTLGRSLEHLSENSTLQQWNRSELSQLQVFVRAAWRSAGGSTGVCHNARNFRGGGHWAKYMGFKGWGSRGHWAEGCGPRPGSKLLRDCIDGKIPCAWSCCGSEELISRGCVVSVHRS